jgi:glutathione synthase/RimK-type ligase-like ATP-grasp enzyme
MRLRIATCRPLPEPDVDEDLLLAALQAAGIDARMAAWHVPAEWLDAVPTVVRSTWDYIHDTRAFSQWVRTAAAGAPLWNPPQTLLGNLHKSYLRTLADRGVPTTPTMLLGRGSTPDLQCLCGARGWRDVVIKPAVGAASYETHRLDASTEAAKQLAARLLATHDLLVQPYLRSVEDHGERALVWIDGEFTHAVRKTPRFAGGVESVSEAVPISAAERALGEAALAVAGDSDLLYARVDVAPAADGLPVVMELELVEPSLFLLQHPPALQRLVDGIVRRLR